MCFLSYSLPALGLTKEPTKDEIIVTTDRTDGTWIQHLSNSDEAGSLKNSKLACVAIVDSLGPVDTLELALIGLITTHHAIVINAGKREAKGDEEEREEREEQHPCFGTSDRDLCVEFELL